MKLSELLNLLKTAEIAEEMDSGRTNHVWL